MTRLAIVGNSHVAALRKGWDPKAHPEVEVTFFAAASPYDSGLELTADRVLRADPASGLDPALLNDHLMAINGRTELDLSAMDAVLLAGFRSLQENFLRFAATCAIDDIHEVADAQRLSAAAAGMFAREMAGARLPKDAWLDWSGPRLFLSAKPRPTDAAFCYPKGRFAHLPVLLETPGAAPRLARMFEEAQTDACAARSVTYLPQPEATLTEGVLTRTDYQTGAPRLDPRKDQPDTDLRHMNAAYGAICLDQICQHLT